MKFDADEAVDRALEVFWRRGYAATSPQALLDELGIGKGSFYNTFESKHNVFTLALERYKDRRLASLTATLDTDGPLREAIEHGMVELTGLDSHRRGCLVVNAVAELAQADPRVDEIAETLFRGIETLLAEAIARGQARGEFASDESAQLKASSLLATIVGASILLKLDADSSRADRAIKDAVLSI